MARARILLVEDDFFIRDVYQKALEMKDFEVWVAGDGNEAIQLVGLHHFDLLLLDIMLPEKSGFEVLDYVRHRIDSHAPVPVVMISNLHSADAQEKARSLGATDYWVKANFTPLKIAEGLDKFINPPTSSDTQPTPNEVTP